MNLFRRHRFLKFVTGAVIIGAPTYGYLKHQGINKDYLLLTLGPVRFGRAAMAGASIVLDYKVSVYGLVRGSEEYKETLSKTHTRSAERLKNLCMRNGGCYTKVGQHLGVLDHLIPPEYVVVMRSLHTHSSPSPINSIYKVLKHDFNKDIDELFLSFDPIPLASASLAQVHKAQLKDGTAVVVKVQHPHVAKTSSVDLKSMQIIFDIISYIFGGLEVEWLMEESRKNLPLELDFEHEALNNQKAAKLFENVPYVKIPKVYWKLSTPRVLTMEYCEGGFINDLNYYKEHQISVKQVIQHLSHLYMQMIFTNGFVHCDPHPGNLLITPDQHPTIVLLDHGLYQKFPDTLRLTYCRLWKAILEGDEEGLAKEAGELGVGKRYQLLACILTGRSWESVQTGLTKQYTKSEESLIRDTAPQLFSEITRVLNTIPRQMVFLLKTNDLIRGVCKTLNYKPDPSSLLHTAKSCLQAIYADQIKKSSSFSGRLYLRCCLWWQLGRLNLLACSYRITSLLNIR